MIRLLAGDGLRSLIAKTKNMRNLTILVCQEKSRGFSKKVWFDSAICMFFAGIGFAGGATFWRPAASNVLGTPLKGG